MKLKPTPQKYKKIIENYYEQLYTNKKDSLQEMDRLREMHNLLRLNKKEEKIRTDQLTQ